MAAKKKDTSTEQKITEAARKIFMLRGYDGARMQEIADEANINKAMLHYYFENKDTLFELIFTEAYLIVAPDLNQLIENTHPLKKRIENFVENYTSLLLEQPNIVSFVVNEMNRNPKMVIQFLKNKTKDYQVQELMKIFEKENKKSKIIEMHPIHFILSIICLCYFPFVGKPMFQYLLKIDEFQYQLLMEQRKKETIYMINQLFIA